MVLFDMDIDEDNWELGTGELGTGNWKLETTN
jgi:hypothetical protein